VSDAINRAHWDALAAVHGEGRDAYYDVEALVGGRDSLSDAEDEAVRLAVGDPDGRDVLHLQCHLGFDAVSLARRGARVTGADFSAPALVKARAIAARAGVAVDYVEADATALPPGLGGRFDLVYATIGVITWIDDVAAWMRSAASALRPGGRLALVEIHPLYNTLAATDPFRADFPYAYDGPRRFDEPGSYADRDAPVAATASVSYAHSLGEVVDAALGAGLRVEALREHLDASFDPRGDLLAREDDGRYRLRLDREALPVLFTLVAARP
jgi:2-polyprenyl-3-methyl-5-hydroxy-6-metoxy-1,4-benzoquinol methylase